MTHTSLKRRALPHTFATVAASGVLSSSPALAATSTRATYKGSTAGFRWGTIQVSIVVKNKKITKARAAKAL